MKKSLLAALVGLMLIAGVSTNSFAGGKHWEGWQETISLPSFPGCGISVRGISDDILQATVDMYCGVDPGGYVGYVNPAVYDIYKARGNKYPDGRTAVLVFEKIGAAFTTDHKDGLPIYGVVAIADGSSVASDEPGHPLNPETCATCHISFDNTCVKRGYLCGNR